MSAPESAGDDATTHHYFADYEVYRDGHAVAWGQAVHSSRDARDPAPARIVAALRAHAAQEHGIDAGMVRLRCICRL